MNVPSKLGSLINKIVSTPAWFSVIIGMVAMLVMVAVIVLDVAMRTAANKPFAATIELVGLLLIILFFSAYAYAELKGEHIQVGVLVEKLPVGTREVVTVSGYFLTLGLVVSQSWQCFIQTAYLKRSSVVSGVLDIPEWPFVLMTSFFLTLFGLALLVSFLNRQAELVTMMNRKAYLWLLPGIVLGLGLFLPSIWPSFFSFEIGRGAWGGIVCVLLFVLLFLKVHIGAAMGLAALLGLSYLSGAEASLTNLATSIVRVGTTYTWSVCPLFMWMGLLVFYAGFAKELYKTAYTWIGELPGGLASASVGACAGFGALTGDSLPGTLAMGAIALPQMRDYKYDAKLATGTIATAGTIGQLIPPSIPFVVYGMLTKVSIGKLFIAGIFPGILCTAIFIIMISLMCRANPKLGPVGPSSSWKERIVSLKDIWSVALLVIFVIGGLYVGFFTPTEAAAVGCFGAFVIGVVERRLTFKAFVDSAVEAVRINSVMVFIFISAFTFFHFLAATNLPYDLAEWLIGLGLPRYGILALILFIYMILGCLMNALPAVILTLPIFYPMAMACGFDPVWFGVLIVVMINVGNITPPIGMNVFAMAAVAKDVPMYTIFRGVLPFWAAYIVLVIILALFPQISLFLPNLM